MRIYGDICELDSDEAAAPRRWRYAPDETARVRFGVRRSSDQSATGLLRVRFRGENWRQLSVKAEATPMGTLTAYFDFFTCSIAPPGGEAACHYQCGTRGVDGTERWDGPERLLMFSRSPRRATDIVQNVVGYAAGAPVLGPTPARAPSPAPQDWRSRTAFSLMIDRFSPPSKNNLGLVATDHRDPHAAHGGTLSGVTDRLDYLAALGVDLLMLSPVYVNAAGGYHGYHPIDLLAVDPRLGDLDDLITLVSQAHARGMAVALDVNVNHMAPLINWRADAEGSRGAFRFDESDDGVLPIYPEEFRHPDFFHDPTSDGDEVAGRLFGFLEDWRTEWHVVRDMLIRHLKYWIAETDIDGFRYDAVRHVDAPFWQTCVPEIRRYAEAIGKSGFMQFGEHSGRTAAAVGKASRKAGFDGMVAYPLYYNLRDLLLGRDDAAQTLRTEIEQNCFSYRDSRYNLGFLENHDVDRVAGIAETPRQAIAMAVMQIAGPWIPYLYYGQEQGFHGRLVTWRAADGREITDDAYVREDMAENPECVWRFGRLNDPGFPPWDQTNPFFVALAKLTRLRRSLPALHRGDYRVLPVTWQDAIVYGMTDGTQTLVIAVRLSGDAPVQVAIPMALTQKHPAIHFSTGSVSAQVSGEDLVLDLGPDAACIVEVQPTPETSVR